MTTIMAIDPGPEQSAWVEFGSDYTVRAFGINSNEIVRAEILSYAHITNGPRLVIEKIASMGMSVGAETFETVYWSGRFAECFMAVTGRDAERIPRVPIKVHLCGTAKAKDANVRQALIDRFGGSKALQKYKAAKVNRHGAVIVPEVQAGPLAGISSHCWAALAVAVVYVDKMKVGEIEVTEMSYDQTMADLIRENRLQAETINRCAVDILKLTGRLMQIDNVSVGYRAKLAEVADIAPPQPEPKPEAPKCGECDDGLVWHEKEPGFQQWSTKCGVCNRTGRAR